ncbi:MAG: DUF3108 domain-containing protein [Candidatus Omnitrophica bacterium]|jgi:hypothetical protein|nr:DUF3108 domain-containing protein [Candidatus Omnitrophota bacterium]
MPQLMMRKYTVLLLIALFAVLIILVLEKAVRHGPAGAVPVKKTETKKQEFPERVGEKIIYDVKMGNVRLGKAEFHHLAKVELNGKTVNQISFKTELFHFVDQEMIYGDPDTYLPLKVVRDILSWPKKEQIIEDYDQQKYHLVITKFVGKNKPQQTEIQRNGPIQNAILLPYCVRRMAKLEQGWTFKANLPTQSFEIQFTGMEDVTVPAGTFKSYHFQSSPSRFEIWISADQRKIPLKIKGSGGIGYVLLMREYIFDKMPLS